MPLGRAFRARIGRGIGRAEHDLVGLGVIRQAIPHRAAILVAAIVVRPPGLRRHFQFGMLERLAWRGRHREEAPPECAGLNVPRRDITACRSIAEIGAGIADHHGIAGQQHCAGRSVGVAALAPANDRVRRPLFRAGLRIERMEPPVLAGDEHHPVTHRDAAVHRVAAGIAGRGWIDAGMEGPQHLPRHRVQRIDDAPDARGIHHPVDHERRRFLPALGAHVISPGKAELARVAVVDIGERGEPRPRRIPADIRPLLTRDWMRGRRKFGQAGLKRRGGHAECTEQAEQRHAQIDGSHGCKSPTEMGPWQAPMRSLHQPLALRKR